MGLGKQNPSSTLYQFSIEAPSTYIVSWGWFSKVSEDKYKDNFYDHLMTIT